MFRTKDADGEFHSFCDCAKGKKSDQVDTACYHAQLVETYPDDFGDIIYEDEEPSSFSMFDDVGRAYYYSVASQSGSSRNRSHKRIIVSFDIDNGKWKCKACPTNR